MRVVCYTYLVYVIIYVVKRKLGSRLFVSGVCASLEVIIVHYVEKSVFCGIVFIF